MTATPPQLLGIGLYTPSQAALYARVSTPLMTRWLWGTKSAEAVVRPQLGQEQDRTVTFLDFVQAMAIRSIRIEHRVSLQKIREAVDRASLDYGVEYVFARKHKTFLFGGDVIIKLNDDEYVQVTGTHAHNHMITEVVELYMRDLTFDASGLASSFEAYNWKDLTVTMDPARRFGEPLIQSCGYSAQSLWEAARSEGSCAAASEAYGVRPDEVELACRYYDHLLGKPAA